MSSGKPEQEELWQRLQHPPAPGEQAVRDGEVGISVQEERWVRMSIICPENSWLHPSIAVGWEKVVLVGGPRAGTSRGRAAWVRFLVTVRQIYRCNWSHLVLSIYQCLENGIFPQAGGDLRVGGQGLVGLQLQLWKEEVWRWCRGPSPTMVWCHRPISCVKAPSRL